MTAAGFDHSRALDEIIYWLRTLLAYEAAVLEAHLSYKTFPKSRREFAEEQVRRMRGAAAGHGVDVTNGVSYLSLKQARRAAELPETMTRAQWEAEQAS